MTKPAIRKAVTKAATGASARADARHLGARRRSSNRMIGLTRFAATPDHFEPDRFLRPFGDRLRAGSSSPLMDDRHAVGDLEQLVEILADRRRRRCPPVARSTSACRISRAAPASTPQVGWSTTSKRGLRMISRPMTNFCRLPPESLRACGSRARACARRSSGRWSRASRRAGPRG